MDLSITFIISLFYYVLNVNATKNGVVGFDDDGMSMDMDMDMDMSMMGMTSDECYATNTPWLQTMAYCIHQNCDIDRYPAEKQAKCFSVQAVAGASNPTFQDSLPATPPTVELPEDAMWLNVTSLVNSNIYYATHGTLGEFARSEYIHTRYSLILYLIVVGICTACGVLTHTTSSFPRLQKQMQTSTLWAKLKQHLLLPALFGSRRLEPLPGNVGYVPGRTLGIFLGVYIVMNIILSSVSFQSFSPNTWFPSPQFEMCEYVGNRTGTLSLVNTSIAILFAGRNNLLIAMTGWSQTTFLTFHRWAARVATLQAVVHSIVYTLAYFEPGSDGASAYTAKAAEPFYWWGIIATIAFCLATAFAVLPIRVKFYEFFLITHIVLAILALIGCWYHIVPHFGFEYGYQVWLYICFAFWSADRLARLARVAYYNRLGNSSAIAEAIPDCDIMQVTVFVRVGWQFGPGQHSFLYLPGLGNFWESHPFSIAGWNAGGQQQAPTVLSSKPLSESDGGKEHLAAESATTSVNQQVVLPKKTQGQDRASIRFLIRAHSGTTSTLLRQIRSSPSASSMEISVYNEGPYAGHRAALQPLLIADTVLCIVGGIGITNALGFIQEFARVGSQRSEHTGKLRGLMQNTKRFILAWSARELGLIEHVKQNFLSEIEGMEISFWHTGPSNPAVQELDSLNDEYQKNQRLTTITTASAASVTAGRMNIENVLRSSVETNHQTTVLVCGPGAMADEITRQVVYCVRDGFNVELIEEAYTW